MHAKFHLVLSVKEGFLTDGLTDGLSFRKCSQGCPLRTAVIINSKKTKIFHLVGNTVYQKSRTQSGWYKFIALSASITKRNFVFFFQEIRTTKLEENARLYFHVISFKLRKK